MVCTRKRASMGGTCRTLLFSIWLYSNITSLSRAVFLGYPTDMLRFLLGTHRLFTNALCNSPYGLNRHTHSLAVYSSRRKPRNCLWEYPRKLHCVECFKIMITCKKANRCLSTHNTLYANASNVFNCKFFYSTESGRKHT